MSGDEDDFRSTQEANEESLYSNTFAPEYGQFMVLGPDSLPPMPVDGSMTVQVAPSYGYGSVFEPLTPFDGNNAVGMDVPPSGYTNLIPGYTSYTSQSPSLNPGGAQSNYHEMDNSRFDPRTSVPVGPSQPIPPEINFAGPGVPVFRDMDHSQTLSDFQPSEPIEVDPKYEVTPPPPGSYRPSLSRESQIDPYTWLPPQEFARVPTGASIQDPEADMGESGRLYHDEKKCFLPNDGTEQDRLDFQHHSLLLCLDGKLSLAPVQSPKYVLDVATGTGIWAMEYAEQHPETQVIGTDLAAIQPLNTPHNCHFVQGDAEEDWSFAQKFDYIHFRAVFTAFDDQPAIMRKAFENLNPGGWVEFFDGSFNMQSPDGTHQGTALQKWGNLIIQGAAAKGRDIEVARLHKQRLIDTGFVDVVEKRFAGALGAWPKSSKWKSLGQMTGTNVHDNCRGISWGLLRATGMEPDDIDKICLDVRSDIKNHDIHAYMPGFLVYGRKPYDWEL